MLSSTIPLFTVNPQTKVREKICNILFPTTLDPEFEPSYMQALQLAKAMDAKVTVYYKEPLIPGPFMSAEVYEYLELEANQRAKDAKVWQELGEKAGVMVESRLDNRPGYVASSISQFANEANFDLIVMCSTATQLSSILLGSATRQVIREAPCPVWVIHNLEI
jgi:nucleotide-binding universal stress UspA family protein